MQWKENIFRRCNIQAFTILKIHSTAERVGKRTVTSLEISSHTKINSAEIRRDLIFFGLKGKRGVGFNIEELISSFNKILGYNDRVQYCAGRSRKSRKSNFKL